MRRTLIALLTALAFLVAHSCQKPYETGIDLAVNNEKIEIPSSAEGHCYITVFSNKDWTIALEPAETWARLDASEGCGIGYVRLDYSENLSGAPRSLEVVVLGVEKVCRIVVTQSATR